jgi:hypothetical protein
MKIITDKLLKRGFRTSLIRFSGSKPPQWPAETTDKGHLQRPGPVPLGDASEQAEFQRLLRENAKKEALEASEGKAHPDAPSKLNELPADEFEGDKNLKTGEIGGPKGKEPTR